MANSAVSRRFHLTTVPEYVTNTIRHVFEMIRIEVNPDGVKPGLATHVYRNAIILITIELDN